MKLGDKNLEICLQVFCNATACRNSSVLYVKLGNNIVYVFINVTSSRSNERIPPTKILSISSQVHGSILRCQAV